MKSKPLLPYFYDSGLVAGCDEAGRGCLAGPVFAAAVILPDAVSDELADALNDSKLLKPQRREYARTLIENQSIAYAVALVDHTEIDRINILQASIKAMHLALDKLTPPPDCIIVDGNRFIPYRFIPHRCFVKGDSKYMAIAAASILAKTYRDAYMLDQHLSYPQYGWNKNKGYPTEAHRDAIAKYGRSPIHRKTFRANKGDLYVV